jgi:hypothetical protein
VIQITASSLRIGPLVAAIWNGALYLAAGHRDISIPLKGATK